jgi:hypothetical protein
VNVTLNQIPKKIKKRINNNVKMCVNSYRKLNVKLIIKLKDYKTLLYVKLIIKLKDYKTL